MVEIFLIVCFLIRVNGDWIKVHHFTPTELNLVKTNPTPAILSTAEVYINNTFINVKTDNTSDSNLNLVESKIVNDEKQPFLFDSDVKDTLLGTHWFLSQQDNTFRGKLIFLQKVKQHLLRGIWEQSKALWNRRTTSPRSMFGFPSMEGALITIAFLTFAVFLIKIVQQFVQGLHGFSPNTVGFQLPMPAQGTRIRRQLDHDEETFRIFQYMDEFKRMKKVLQK